MPKSAFTPAYDIVITDLVDRRKAAGVSQVELATKIGKTQQFVSAIENRIRRIDLVEWLVLIRAIGGDPAEAASAIFVRIPPDQTI